MRLSRSECFYCSLIIAGNGGDVPVLQVVGEYVAVGLGGESDTLGDSLEVLDSTAGARPGRSRSGRRWQ